MDSEYNPLAIILVENSSKGNKLLFRYPFEKKVKQNNTGSKGLWNESGISAILACEKQAENKSIKLTNDMLSDLFSVKPQLCGQKFELTFNSTKYVGHPFSLQHQTNGEPEIGTRQNPKFDIDFFHVVFALPACVQDSVANCYYDFSVQLGKALYYEEYRVGYLSRQARSMLRIHETMNNYLEGGISPYQVISVTNELAQVMKDIYESLCSTGHVSVCINNWMKVGFCLPHKVNRFIDRSNTLDPTAIEKCFRYVRPYHGLIMRIKKKELYSILPTDGSFALRRLIRYISPFQSMESLSRETGIELLQVYSLAEHLVYWGKATLVYPLSESNVYIISPHAPTTKRSSVLAEMFEKEFPGKRYERELAYFSLPKPLVDHYDVTLTEKEKAKITKTVVWFLQHRLILQVHTFVHLVAQWIPENKEMRRCTERLGKWKDFFDCFPDFPDVNIDRCVTVDHIRLQCCQPFKNNCFHQYPAFVNLSDEEKRNVLKLPVAKNPEDLILFARMCSYLRGKHHFEEIMYRENVTRSQLVAFIDRYRDVLHTSEHEEPLTAVTYDLESD